MSRDRLGAVIADQPGPQIVRKAKVSSFSIGTPGVTPTLVTVLVDGQGDPVPGVGTLRGYAPSVDDWVWVLTQPGFWIILDAIG